MEFNKEQLKAINIRENCIVSAGAGSGKTTVLAQRFISLLNEEDIKIENILCLTFTKKAAYEMQERIYNLLLTNKEKNLQESKNNFFKSNIMTLDSFCYNVVKENIYNYGISPDFKIIEEKENQQIEKEIYKFIFNELTKYIKDYNINDNLVNKYLLSFNFKEIIKDFYILNSEYFNIVDLFDIKNNIINKLNKIKEDLHIYKQDIYNIIQNMKSLELNNKQLEKIYEYEIKFNNLELKDFIYIKSPNFRVESYKILNDSLKDIINAITNIYITLENEDFIIFQANLIEKYQYYIIKQKRKNNLLSFNDLLKLTIQIMKNNKKILKFYNEKFKYIMIDEFQDNNKDQKDLLYLLSLEDINNIDNIKNNKLFFVGDEKQSIYAFRKADISVFEKLKDIINNNIILNYNYRSNNKLIHFYNEFFDKILIKENSFEVDFIPLKEVNNNYDSEIILYFYPYKSENNKENNIFDNEAYNIGKIIYNKVKDNSNSYSDFAILLRTKTYQKYIEKWLNLFLIPYQNNKSINIFYESFINDLYNILTLLIYNNDKYAYSCYLRSPIVNISLNCFIKLIDSNYSPFFIKEFDKNNLINNNYIDNLFKFIEKQEIYQQFNENDKTLYKIALYHYFDLMIMSKKDPPYKIINYIWYNLGYRYKILENKYNHSHIEHYNYIFNISLSHKENDLITFLTKLRKIIDEKDDKDNIILSRMDNTVNILTIHKAKGLEYETVFIPFCGTSLSYKNNYSTLYIDKNNILFPNIKYNDKKFNFFKEKELTNKKNAAELKRLLYVAFTRAKKNLIISGHYNSINKNKINFLNLIIDNIFYNSSDIKDYNKDLNIDDALKEKFKNLIEIKILPEINKQFIKNNNNLNKLIEIYKQNIKIKDFIDDNKKYISVTKINKNNQNIFYYNDKEDEDKIINQGSSFGILIHKILELRIKYYFEFDNFIDINECNKLINKNIKSNFDYFDTSLKEAFSISDIFFNSDFFKEIKNKILIIESEFKFNWNIENNIYIVGIIDLIIYTEKEIFVIDFKSDQEINIDNYKIQLSIYKKVIQELNNIDNIKSFLFYLRYDKFIEIDYKMEKEEIINLLKI